MISIALAFLRTKAGMATLALLGLIACLLIAIAYGAANERKREAVRDAIAQAEATALDAKADQKSTEQLAADAARIADKQERLEDAVAEVADETPTAADVVYGCRELQSHGLSTADLPACRSVGG